MSALLEQLSQQLGGNTLEQISQKTGLDPSTISKIVAAAIPLLLTALARNASSQQGAASLAGALDRDHDGSVLNDLAGFLGSGAATSQGAGILGHLLGGRQETVAASLGQATGADSGSVTQVLQMLAPVVMGALGRNAREQSALDPTALSSMLGQEQAAVEQQLPQGTQMLTNLLDSNKDGSVFDDLTNLASRFFGSRG